MRHLYLHIEVPTIASIATKGGTKKGVSLALIGGVVGGIAGQVVLMVIVGICIVAGVHYYRRHKRTSRITSATGDAQMMPVVNKKSADGVHEAQTAPATSNALPSASQLPPDTFQSPLTRPPEVCEASSTGPLISAAQRLSVTSQILLTYVMDRQSLKSTGVIDQSQDHQLTTKAATTHTA